MSSAFQFLRWPLAAIAIVLGRLAKNRDGNVALLFGLAAIPVIIGAGIAMDTARAYMVKNRLGSALDAAALAVGSQTNQPTATLTTDLNNYFYNNFCKAVPSGVTVTQCATGGVVAGETSVSVVPITDITAATVTYQATATVPTTFMQLVGVTNLTVSVTTQTTKFPGMEIAVVLDQTGSMLCGAAATASSGYSNCSSGTVSTDTTCSNSSNLSRICTLAPAAQQFVQTLQNAITGPQSIYMSIVPYVTQVNAGSFCTSSTSCNNIWSDPTSGNFLDIRGNMLPVVPIKGNTSTGSQTISSVQTASIGAGTPPATAYASGTSAIVPGMYIFGPGIPYSTTNPWIVSSVASSTSIVVCPASSMTSTSCNSTSTFPTMTATGASLVVGPQPFGGVLSSGGIQSTPIGIMGPSATVWPNTNPLTGTWTTGSANVTSVSSTAGMLATMFVAGCSAGTANSTTTNTNCTTSIIPAADTITSSPAITTTQFTLTTKPGTAESAKPLYVSSIKGTASSGSANITSLGFATGATIKDCTGGTLAIADILPGMGVSGPSIPTNTYVASTTSTTITLSANATTGAFAGEPLMFTNQGGNTSNASTTISCVSLNISDPTTLPGNIITGNGIPPNTTITAATGNSAAFAAGTGSLTISNAATATNNTELDVFAPITYATSWNGSTTGTAAANWGGCVVEPTSSGENSGSTGVHTVTGNPDTSEPVSGVKFYPFYWNRDTVSNWQITTSALANNVKKQDSTTESQGSLSSYDALDGPNQGCPAPILPLTDLTSTAGAAAINTAISIASPPGSGGLWPRDAGGTQVHVGMIWGWRVLSPNGPFPVNNGHPLSYGTAGSTGWKKIVVLMTDGSEEWPTAPSSTAAGEYTGMGTLPDGKLGTTSNSTTAESTLNTRLSTLCTNMQGSSGNFIIYTIGLGTDGANNTQLQSCASDSTKFYAATPSNLTTVFTSIANSIIHLRLTK